MAIMFLNHAKSSSHLFPHCVNINSIHQCEGGITIYDDAVSSGFRILCSLCFPHSFKKVYRLRICAYNLYILNRWDIFSLISINPYCKSKITKVEDKKKGSEINYFTMHNSEYDLHFRAFSKH
jgi:hypothetical protein